MAAGRKPGGGGSGGNQDASSPSDSSTGSDAILFGDTVGSGPMALVVEPATATIDVVDGMSMPASFKARFVYDDGSMSDATGVAWSLVGKPIANVTNLGEVSATGTLGGELSVVAKTQGLEGTAAVTIVLHINDNTVGFSPGDITLLDGASNPDPSLVWAYPYDATVFPRGLAAPEQMWNGGAAGDQYLIKLTTPYVEIKHYTTADPPSRVQVSAAAWQQLTESGDGASVNVEMARLSAGVATVAPQQTWTIAPGELRGSVYYWANNLGRILRIKPGAPAPDDFLADAGITGCSTCHTVSANGSRLVIGGDIQETTFDLKNGMATLSGQARAWAMPAVSADGTVVVQNNAPLPGPPGGSTGAFDADTGQALTNTGLEGHALWMPAFSADDKSIAYVHSSTKDLHIWDWDAALKQASNDRLLVPQGSNPTYPLISFPTPAPDHRFVLYQRGNAASYDTRDGNGAFYITATDVPAEIRLATLNGDSYPFVAGARDLDTNYEPVYAPLPSGGYYWVVFTSRRTYGNLLTGSSSQVKQLWVAAIDLNPAPGADPSHPAFWLAGQDPNTLNMRGYWALDPCKDDGEPCTDGSECCQRSCVTTTDGGSMCGVPPDNECVQNGNSCEMDSDCCAFGQGIFCVSGICTQKGPS